MRLHRTLAAAAIVGLTTGAAFAQSRDTATGQLARVTLGSIRGVVSDESGGPLTGAMVSALGATTAMAITDLHGRFVIPSLPPGEYVLRVHMPGFASTRREAVRVGTAAADVSTIQLRRVGAASTLASRPILTAGIEVPEATTDDGTDDHPHTELAWRLRHIKRNVLKQEGSVVTAIADAEPAAAPPDANSPSLFGRALAGGAGMAASFFTETPFTGEVNFLTTSTFGPGDLFTSDFVPRGVAFVEIGAPLPGGRWDVRASMSQADVSAWILAGTMNSRLGDAHQYTAGVSYGAQQFVARMKPLTPAAASDGSRAVGELFASDRWQVSQTLALDYGSRIARFDYLPQRTLFSPHVGMTISPFSNTRVVASAEQRMLAPGAEEFLAPASVGPWLPPERTFAPLAGEDFQVERTRFYDVGIEHEFDGLYVIGVRRFHQDVDHQMTALFGLPVDGGPQSPGHYYVANAGAVDADGWVVRLANTSTQRVRGSVDYTLTRARWISRGDMAAIAIWAPEAIRPRVEDVHDITTSVETDIPETATRVFVLYKVNNAFARGNDATKPVLDYRFDVQVNQGLPFMPLRSARWEVLVGVRNLFRDPAANGSVYDELLVVRPPTRVIGGVLVKF